MKLLDATNNELIESLRKVDFFNGVPEAQLRSVAAQMRPFVFTQGEKLIEEGVSGKLGRMYIVLEGTAQVDVGGAVVDSYGPGDHFGEMSFLDDQPRSATVTATTTVRVAGLAPWNLRAVLVEQPRIAINMLEVLARRLRAQNDTVRP